MPDAAALALSGRYTRENGQIFASGSQALIRALFDQARADREAGRNTRTFLSGYPGSPLGGIDGEMGKQRKLAAELGVTHRPGLNEELAASAVWATQLVSEMRRRTVDGVVGAWYGKAPGLERSADAIRHGNFVGAHRDGGLVAFCGDDPTCKSSTVPSASEPVLAALGMPVLYPGSPQEAIDLTRHAVASSRASGLWTAVKVVTQVADAVGSMYVGPDRVVPVPVALEGEPYVHVPRAKFAGPIALEMERSLMGPRRALALEYARANDLNAVRFRARHARLGIVCSGVGYYDLREALDDLGLNERDLDELGIAILKLDLIWPLDGDAVRSFARGLEELLVLEDKGPFLESAVRDELYATDERIPVLGRLDDRGRPLNDAPALDAAVIARIVGRRLLEIHGPLASVEDRLAAIERATAVVPPSTQIRKPFFCAGCPHNRSTVVPEGSVVGAGIGCHGMLVFEEDPTRGEITGVTQMGGEGTQWIGQSAYLENDHIFQNLGDGTFHHSGSLAIRAAIGAGVNITYKLLWNNAVSMTGGQDIEGGMSLESVTHWLLAEGVRRVVVVSPDPSAYDGIRFPEGVDVVHRNRLVDVQRELREVRGVTVLVNDQDCAAELRRARKRGLVPEPVTRIAINERVCEGCGDCGRKSHCLAVLPVDTEFGRKTRIHQASCNKDYSCVEGHCPSFLKVVPGAQAKRTAPEAPLGMPSPAVPAVDGTYTVRMVGIGGTGVVTVAQIMGMAAVLDDLETVGLDQTGLAQKGGAVVSDVRFVGDGRDHSARSSLAGADVLLGFDVLATTAAANLSTADPARTRAVVSTTQVPTGDMIGDPDAHPARIEALTRAVDEVTVPGGNVYLDAEALALELFDDHLQANAIVLGAAWQAGMLPLREESIRRAFELNGASVEKNLAAFAWGRAVVCDPDAVRAATQTETVATTLDATAREIVDAVAADPGSELERLLEVRVPDLIGFQSAKLARRYAATVGEILAADREAGGDGTAALAFATQLHRLMAYKDEYEIARLHLDPEERARIRREFGEDAKIRYQLQPPILRYVGIRRKISLGRWFDPVFRLLRAMRWARGHWFDPFGHDEVRRLERALPVEYEALARDTLAALRTDYARVAELWASAEAIRGYDHVKLDNVARWRAHVETTRETLGAAVPALEVSVHQGGAA